MPGCTICVRWAVAEATHSGKTVMSYEVLFRTASTSMLPAEWSEGGSGGGQIRWICLYWKGFNG